MTSTIRGRIKPEVEATELFEALYPCGSITGAPKHRTMEIIHELERTPRGLYTGAIGWFEPPTSRSEEHTSELQSLMRISYAVFCLKKQTKTIKRKKTLIKSS